MPGERPVRRYPSAELLAGDLGRWLDGRPISARPARRSGSLALGAGSGPVIPALATAMAAALSVSVGIVLLLWQRALANVRMSDEVLNELVDLSIGGGNFFPTGIHFDRKIAMLEKERECRAWRSRERTGRPNECPASPVR